MLVRNGTNKWKRTPFNLLTFGSCRQMLWVTVQKVDVRHSYLSTVVFGESSKFQLRGVRNIKKWAEIRSSVTQSSPNNDRGKRGRRGWGRVVGQSSPRNKRVLCRIDAGQTHLETVIPSANVHLCFQPLSLPRKLPQARPGPQQPVNHIDGQLSCKCRGERRRG